MSAIRPAQSFGFRSTSNTRGKAFTNSPPASSSGEKVIQMSPIKRIGVTNNPPASSSGERVIQMSPIKRTGVTNSPPASSSGERVIQWSPIKRTGVTNNPPASSSGERVIQMSPIKRTGITNSPPASSSGERVIQWSPIKRIGVTNNPPASSSGERVIQMSPIKRTGVTNSPPASSSGERVIQWSPIKRTGGTNHSKSGTSSATNTDGNSSNFSSGASKSNSNFNSPSKPTSANKPNFSSFRFGSNSNSYTGANSSSAASSSSSFGASKSTSNFYSSTSSSANKPNFSSFKSKYSSYGQNPSKPQGQWQKGQTFGGKNTTFGSTAGGSAYGGGLTGRCVLVSRKRFEVVVTFHAKLIEIFKQMSSKSYDAATKKWSFDLSEYDTLMDAVKCLRPAVDIQPLPKGVCNAFRSQRHGVDKPRHMIPHANLNSIDSKLVNALMPFQREGVNFAVHNEGRVLIADEMGLGKTLQAICVAYYYRTEWPLLIVTPSSLRYSWAEALEKWLPSLDPDSINVVLTGKDDATAGLVNIMSYDLLSRKGDVLTKAGFQVIIMDESHFMKNIKSARSRAAVAILKNAPRVILLSGTPALSRPAELFTQVKAVRPHLFPSHFHDFGIRYCDGRQNPWGWDYTGSSNLSELQLLLEETVMIRRMKADVLTQLPSKTRQMVHMDPQSVKTNSKALKSAASQMSKKTSGTEQRGALMQYFNETGVAKIPAIKDYVGDLLESGCKMLVFAHHKAVLDAVCQYVTGKKQGYIRIDGSTSAIQRKQQCDRFQESDDCRVAVLSITAANAGLTLTAASLVVFAELFWNPGIMIQAEDRVHRIGQKDCVNIRYLIAKGTADDYIWPLVQKKLTVLEKAGLSKDDFSEVDTTTFEDPRQRKILSFFEQSFFEEDEESALEELALLEAAEADGIASQPPDDDEPSHSSTVQSEAENDGSKTTPQEVCTEKPRYKGKSSCKSTTSDSSSVASGEAHTEIKRLAKSTLRKLDKWRKVDNEEENEEQAMEDFAEEVVAECFDPDMAVLEEDSSDRDSPTLLQMGVPGAHQKRTKTLWSATQSQSSYVPPTKKQRNL